MGENILDLIGNTPIVRIDKLNPNPRVKIYAKLESYNPGGSVKDRIAKYMIEGAEREGKLKRGMTIVEPTSGNTGIGLALVGGLKGYKVKIVMPESMSSERRRILEAYGAELVLTEADKGMLGTIEKARELAQNPGYFMPDQFSNPFNVLAHYETTGKEILQQVPEIDMFIAGIGTGGTVTGVAKRLKESKPEVKVIAVEPYPRSRIQGLKSLSEGYVPPIIDFSLIDEKVYVEDEDAFKTAREIILKEGISVGMSSGAILFEAVRRARRMERGNIVVIFPDGYEKYLSTELFR